MAGANGNEVYEILLQNTKNSKSLLPIAKVA